MRSRVLAPPAGLLLARITHRVAALPALGAHALPFDALYETDASVARLAALGVRAVRAGAVRRPPDLALHRVRRTKQPASSYEQRFGRAAGECEPIALDCPYLALLLGGNSSLRSLYWQIDAALVPSALVAKHARQIEHVLTARARRRAGGADPVGPGFVALHVRSKLSPGAAATPALGCRPRTDVTRAGAACEPNVELMHNVFAIERVPRNSTVYIAGEAAEAMLRASRAAWDALRSRYDLVAPRSTWVSWGDEGGGGRGAEALQDLRDAVDYVVCSRAALLIGSSKSNLAALLLLRREYARQQPSEGERPPSAGALPSSGGPWAPTDFRYDGEDAMPLESALFSPAASRRRLLRAELRTWAFVASDATPEYDALVRTAVLSALRQTTLSPVCLFLGSRTSALARWLEAQDVVLLYHTPLWAPFVCQATHAAKSQALANKRSPNFASYERLLATFSRVDLPVLGFVQPFVLYSDTDVLFMRTPVLADFGPPPRYFTIGIEGNLKQRVCNLAGAFLYTDHAKGLSSKQCANKWEQVGNLGVMLMHVPEMRRTHQRFVAHTFTNESVHRDGLMFVMGPADQGAYNGFYLGHALVRTAPVFNWKPYWGAAKPSVSVAIVHFHGPKPHDFEHAHAKLSKLAGAKTVVQALKLIKWDTLMKGDGVTPKVLWPLVKRCFKRNPGTLGGVDTCYDFVKRWYLYRQADKNAKAELLPGSLLPASADPPHAAATKHQCPRSAPPLPLPGFTVGIDDEAA